MMHLKKTIVLCLLIFFQHTVYTYAQKPKEILNLMNTIHSPGKNFYSEIPFEYRNDHIIIKVKIGTELYDYVFDTGGYNDITDAIQEKNNFPVISSQIVGSSNKLKSRVNIVRVDSLSIGDLLITDLAALQMNFLKAPSMCDIDGALIGASIIKNFCWQIDFPSKKMIITDDFSKIKVAGTAIKVPVTFNNRLMPYIEANLDGRNEKFMFDLGSSSLVSITGKTAKKYINDKKIIELYGGATEGANGIVKLPVNVFEASTFNIGTGVKYSSKPVVYTDLSNENLIGNPVIRDFIVTLNFKDNELYLTPIDDSRQLNGWYSFGLKIENQNGKYIVTSIYQGLAAEKAGVKLGDEIIEIDGHVLNCKGYCECRTFIDNELQGKTAVVLKIKIQGSTKEIKLNKEKVF